MPSYNVYVYSIPYSVHGSSFAEAHRKGLDRWRVDNNQKDKNDNYRIPEPRTAVVALVDSTNPKDS